MNIHKNAKLTPPGEGRHGRLWRHRHRADGMLAKCAGEHVLAPTAFIAEAILAHRELFDGESPRQ